MENKIFSTAETSRRTVGPYLAGLVLEKFSSYKKFRRTTGFAMDRVVAEKSDMTARTIHRVLEAVEASPEQAQKAWEIQLGPRPNTICGCILWWKRKEGAGKFFASVPCDEEHIGRLLRDERTDPCSFATWKKIVGDRLSESDMRSIWRADTNAFFREKRKANPLAAEMNTLFLEHGITIVDWTRRLDKHPIPGMSRRRLEKLMQELLRGDPVPEADVTAFRKAVKKMYPTKDERPERDVLKDAIRYCAACWRSARLPLHEWDDATQEVFRRLLEKGVSTEKWNLLFQEDAPERREFIRAIDATKKKVHRSKSRETGLLEYSVASPDTSESLKEDREEIEVVAQQHLTVVQQHILQLFAHGYRIPEIAQELNIPETRVSDMKYKAIRKLREAI
jgi:RNA polymerase sigma factor (sigma-70 family)